MYFFNIKEKRKAKKISQQSLAKKCDITRETLNRIENGKQPPSFKLLNRIANELETTIHELLDDSKSA
jgi:putative transcriptional regulator